MNKIKFAPSDVPPLVHELKSRSREYSRMAAWAENMVLLLEQGRICGSWIACRGDYSVLIRQSPIGFTATLCSNALCYKKVERVMDITLERGSLVLTDIEDGKNTGQKVGIDPASGRLELGHYGLFDPEEATLEQIYLDDNR